MSWAEEKTLEKFIADQIAGIGALLDPNPVFGFVQHMATLSPGNCIEYIGANKKYTPFSLDTASGAMDLGSWAEFPVLKNNKPCMVKADGTKDYELDPTDYTKKADGTASDVANTSYSGAGAFSWIQRIYKLEYVSGTDRYVLFCMTKKNDSFEPVGFLDGSNNVLEGVWIPMFYGVLVDSKLTSFATGTAEKNMTTAAQKTAIDNVGARARFYGGPIAETIADLLTMWAKTTDLQGAYGLGNSSGYNSSDTNYGMKANQVVGGGQFYGTVDGRSVNKILHSMVLGTYNQWQRDPYEIVKNGRVYVSTNYNYALDASGYEDSGINIPDLTASWKYPNIYVSVPKYGPVPVPPYNGSTTTGGCDGCYTTTQSNLVAVCLRFGHCNYALTAGPRARTWDYAATDTNWTLGASLLLLPPVGAAA